MSLVADRHERLGASFVDRDGRRVVDHYGRPERTHRAVRNVVGVVEMAYGVVVVEGDDRVEFVDNTISCTVPRDDGTGRYGFLLDPQGRVDADMYVYGTGERLLLFLPPGRAAPVASEWADRTFIQDVTVRDASDEFGVFGVHGPTATEKVASVLSGPAAPSPALSFARGQIADAGVTVIATDAPTGEEGYEVVCAAADADDVFDELLTGGVSAAPFGYRTYDTLTLEAGTPLYHTELAGRLPNVLGARAGIDLSKGCFVGQEVVSKVANRGQPSGRLVGLLPESLPAAGAAVFAGDDRAGEVTRAAVSPSLDRPACLAVVEYDLDSDAPLAADVDGDRVPAATEPLPFVEGSERSGRLPVYDGW
jgi:aminomethyltransferase